MARSNFLYSLMALVSLCFSHLAATTSRAVSAFGRFTEEIFHSAFPYAPREPTALPSLTRSETSLLGVALARLTSFRDRRLARSFGVEPCLGLPLTC